jgi:hypothetical protein
MKRKVSTPPSSLTSAQKAGEKPIVVTQRDYQKHVRRYARLVQKGAVVRVVDSRKRTVIVHHAGTGFDAEEQAAFASEVKQELREITEEMDAHVIKA